MNKIPHVDTLFISDNELKLHGCRNCVWKMHGMCPHGMKGNDVYDGDLCSEFRDFLLSFHNEGESINALWEKYNLYILRLQSLEDYKHFMELKNKLDSRADDYDRKELEVEYNSYKLWWYRLNDSVLRGLSKIVDRENKDKLDVNINIGKIDLRKIHRLMSIEQK